VALNRRLSVAPATFGTVALRHNNTRQRSSGSRESKDIPKYLTDPDVSTKPYEHSSSSAPLTSCASIHSMRSYATVLASHRSVQERCVCEWTTKCSWPVEQPRVQLTEMGTSTGPYSSASHRSSASLACSRTRMSGRYRQNLRAS